MTDKTIETLLDIEGMIVDFQFNVHAHTKHGDKKYLHELNKLRQQILTRFKSLKTNLIHADGQIIAMLGKIEELETELAAAGDCKGCKFEKYSSGVECHDCRRSHSDHFEALKAKEK